MSTSSDGRGNGRIAKFHRRVSEAAGCREGETLPYAPDFLDSLVCRMATRGGDLVERTFAWMIYRASGNQSEKAIHLYGVKGEAPIETALRQRDCALDLAWLESGFRSEWLDAPIAMFRVEAARRGVVPIDKTLICDGFTENRERGTVARGTGYYLVLIASPKVADSTEHCRKKGESREYQDFCARWKVAHSAECEEEQVARSVIKRINKIRLSAYRESRKSPTAKTSGTPSLEASKTSEASEAAPVLPPLRSSLIETTNPSSSSRENDVDARTVLVKATEDKRMSHPKLKAEAPDQEFSKGVIAAFVNGGKPSPTSHQILALQQAIPDEPEARVEFVPYLSEKMPRLKHPGLLPSIAEEFTAAWPELAAREQALRAAPRRRDPQVLTLEGVRRHLTRCVAQLGQGYEAIATKLEQLATQADLRIENTLESVLQELDVRLLSIAESSVTDAERKKLEAVPPEMQRSMRMMTSQQRTLILRQLFEKALIELRGLPRLSLFYMD